MVEHAIKLMGRPSDFQDAEEPQVEEEENASISSFSWDKLKFGRRLFRDPDDNVLGGVCSGLSAYLGIKDPVFMRIVFLILIFGFGVSVFFYLLLWIIIPEAKSPIVLRPYIVIQGRQYHHLLISYSKADVELGQ